MLPVDPDQPEEQQQQQPDPEHQPPVEAGLPQLQVPMKKQPIQFLTIIGQIEGHMALPPQNKTTKYEHIIPALISIEQDEDVKGFVVLLNTMGGDVEAGLAIAELIRGMTKPSVSLVLGGGHSIGVPLAVSTSYSYIAPTATMTVHPIRMSGLVIGVSQTYDYFNRMQERIVSFVVENSDISRDTFREMMLRTGDLANDVGTILVGKEAVDCKLIQEVGTLKDALAKVNQLIV